MACCVVFLTTDIEQVNAKHALYGNGSGKNFTALLVSIPTSNISMRQYDNSNDESGADQEILLHLILSMARETPILALLHLTSWKTFM